MSLSQCFNVEDFRRLARRKLPRPIFDYLDGGADDEWSLENNAAAFRRWRLMPQYLRDISTVDTQTTILGARAGAPAILSPTGMSRLFHHEKEIAVARAAGDLGLFYCLSTMATTTIEDAAAASAGPKMFQIYIHKDRGLTKELVARCRAAGYDALCLTVDAAVAGNRERDRRSGFVMPPRLTAAGFASFATHFEWTFNLLRDPGFDLVNVRASGGALGKGATGVIEYIDTQFDRTVTWDDAARLIEEWGGPFAIKGIQSADDARRAVDIGASAIMISNHGGRQLDSTPAPVECVRPMRDAIGDRAELIVDGGVRRGTHVLKALALGADAVSFGRPYLYALAAGGERGVRRFLSLFLEDLERSLALLGCARVADVDARHLRDLAADETFSPAGKKETTHDAF
ncbi:alpha-hydroxy acid oxidase [Amphiplicatus metriothermophilus]|uniref:L-lactate dehydrogenase (Cytochrome) n=1 Tax=Amphiplicatus metriothermophilus TaxID=1519374 RepID=A0A239PW79_9PROT|nr:alpha-hydroxy acid oxidase [Amphiplicatus metriothermophilus]MBB5519643.1 L-lactate dehydrogenase (cytochrome) [Amphiplicatus metriothermophilus]SNT74206.1 L-lactate dehydrogenase (cytochrome) [Amphiplicatus metriothermophilus]